MGYIRHDAIVVTAFDGEHLVRAMKIAQDLGLPISEPVPSWINGYESFLIAPDGSKEGWVESTKGDEARAALIEALRAAGGLYVDWAQVSFGGDSRAAHVVDHGDNLPDEDQK